MSDPPPAPPAEPEAPAAGEPSAPAVDVTAAPRMAADPMVGTVISERYRLVELVATGGMGAVYKAEHLLLRKWMAIKLLRPEARDFPGHVARFEREAIAGAHIHHRNVVSATDFGKLPDGAYFLVLEYVSGVPLDRVIKQGPMEPVRAVAIARQIAEALGAAHERGIIHRDVKPNNIMLEEGQSDHVKIIDFGLAKVPLERLPTTDRSANKPVKDVKLTLNGTVFGTVAYMSPEAALGMDRVDERSDLYALGITLYEMLAGKHPFDATDPVKLFQQQRTATPPPLRLRTPGINVPHELEEIVMRLLRKEPDKRYANAGALIEALDAAMPSAKAAALVSWKSPLPPAVAGALVAAETESISSVDPSSANPAWLTPEAGGPRDRPSAAPARSPSEAPPAKSPSEPPPAKGPSEPPAAARAARAAEAPAEDAPRSRGKAKASAKGQGARTVRYQLRLPTPRRGAVAKVWTIGVGIGLAVGVLGVFLSFRAPSKDGRSHRSPEESASAGATSAPPAGKGALAALSDAASPVDPDEFIAAANDKEWTDAETAMFALAEQDPSVFHQRDVMAAAAAVAVRGAFRGDARGDQVFDVLANRLGADGLDILYEVVSVHGGTKGAERAAEILKNPAVLERTNPALRVAIELRAASCSAVSALFERAGNEGDGRALVVLEMLRSSHCRPRSGQCCYRDDKTLERAVSTLKQRLRQ